MSTFQLQPCINLDLSQRELQDLIDKAKDWTLMHGMYSQKYNNCNIYCYNIFEYFRY